MGKMLSEDTRNRLIQAYESGIKVKDIAQFFSVNPSTVYRMKKLKHTTGSLKPRTDRCGRTPLLTDENIREIDRLIEERNDITIHEINEKLQLPVSDETVRRAVIKLGYRVKKNDKRLRKRTSRSNAAAENMAGDNPGKRGEESGLSG